MRSSSSKDFMHNLWADLRYSFRSFRKAPVFTAIAVLSLALGIGANTAIFTLLDQVLLRLLPVKDPQQLVLFTMRGRHYGSNWGGNMISYPMYRDFQDHNRTDNGVFSGMFARRAFTTSLMFEGRTERVSAELVSGSYFPVLGVGAFIGRTFTPDDDRAPGANPEIVLTYDYWQSRFAGDRTIVGKTVAMNGRNMTVIGVAQSGFSGMELGFTPCFFLPISMQKESQWGNPDMLTDRRTRWVNAFGRLKPGVKMESAQVSLQPFMHAMLDQEVREKAFNNASAFDREQFLRCWMSLLPGAQGRTNLQRATENTAVGADGDYRDGAADRLREYREFIAGSRGGKAEGDRGASGDRREPWAHHAATDGGKPDALGARCDSRTCGRVLGGSIANGRLSGG